MAAGRNREILAEIPVETRGKNMQVIRTEFGGLLILQPKVFGDQRGYLFEFWNRAVFAEAGIVADFVQDNESKDLLNNFYYKRTGKVAATWYVIDVFQNKEKAYHVNKVKLC